MVVLLFEVTGEEKDGGEKKKKKKRPGSVRRREIGQ